MGRAGSISPARPRRSADDVETNCTSPMAASTQQNIDIRRNGSEQLLATECRGREDSFGEVRLRALTFIFPAPARAEFVASSDAAHTPEEQSCATNANHSPPPQTFHCDHAPDRTGIPGRLTTGPADRIVPALSQARILGGAGCATLPRQRAVIMALGKSSQDRGVFRFDANYRLVWPEAKAEKSFNLAKRAKMTCGAAQFLHSSRPAPMVLARCGSIAARCSHLVTRI
jgi:hypothetical protein